MKVSLQVNKKMVEIDVPPKKSLLDILRDDLGLIGTKKGCGKGECGACTVIFNGKRVNSCLVPALQLDGSKIITIEGLKNWSAFPMIEKAYIEHGAVQCGFCITGFVISTISLFVETSLPITNEQIKWSLGGNLCRCTGYTKIFEAVYDISNQIDTVQLIKRDWHNEFNN